MGKFRTHHRDGHGRGMGMRGNKRGGDGDGNKNQHSPRPFDKCNYTSDTQSLIASLKTDIN